MHGRSITFAARTGSTFTSPLVNRHGTERGSVGGPVALIGSFMDHPGEQMLSYLPNGTLQVWGGGAAGR